ncbi:hypothetical protein Ahy_B06g086046 isoform A [Arachis hypogaea]|uniref:Uncharacterized protein n=1 Tax=Arachis hypogaea TaxID=3818 RepID=A0A444YWM2_ARAHY|nr:hypothetical protein Ahy_B06g086046 isoform A [Arachis hypogaea]
MDDWYFSILKSIEKKPSHWWSNIRDELIQIFKPIFATLKNMFLEDQYHGKLSIHNIKVGFSGSGQLRAILTDMECRNDGASTEYIQDKQLLDIKVLRSIIYQIINLPFKAGNEPHIPEVEELYHQLYFLEKKYEASSFPRWQFNENIHPEFSKIYHHRGNSGQYSSNRAIVKFYRNCIQHFVFRETQDGAPKPNSLVAIHKLFVDHFEIMMPSIMLTEKICGRMRESIAVAEHVM